MSGPISVALDSQFKTSILNELKKLVSIPSISFPHFDHAEVRKCAEATADLLKRSGFRNVEVMSIRNCLPYVVGDYIVDPKLPTVLLYAHHDVQPPGREEVWKTPPFVPTEINGRLYGRGTADDKAGILIHVAAFQYWLKNYKSQFGRDLPVNFKIIIEGEEEVGSDHLLDFLNLHKERLKADTIIVTDTANIDSGIPSLTTSLRGLVAFDIEVKALKAPLHSGLWGGGVADPVQAIVKILSRFTNDKGEITLKSVSASTKRREAKGIPITREEFARQAGVLQPSAVPENFWQKIFFEPSFSINALQASSEKLANNIICDRAFARFGIRLTSAEKSSDVEAEVLQKLKDWTPPGVELVIKSSTASDGWECDPEAPQNKKAFEAAVRGLDEAYGKKTCIIGCGASIPFIGPFEKALKAPVLTLGVEDPYTLAHSENESLNLDDFYKTIEGEIRLLHYLSGN
jgi:acetylornithine deacetylase/succinyl-diaminopimelate desuccinylase-like protein